MQIIPAEDCHQEGNGCAYDCKHGSDPVKIKVEEYIYVIFFVETEMPYI
jgi:hypothetical protein